MFLLIRRPQAFFSFSYDNLHSTMFLLIPVYDADSSRLMAHLHSTMFLLIRSGGTGRKRGYDEFTFHNVSINSVMFMDRFLPFIMIYIPQCFY